MIIGTINAGSTSVKLQIFDTEINTVCEQREVAHNEVESHIKELGEKYHCTRVIHRIVHGGLQYTQPCVATPEVLKNIQSFSSLAPLHNPPALRCVALAQRYFADTTSHWLVFDTSYHTTIPFERQVYGIPLKYATEEGVRRYGFHGISHQWVSLNIREIFPQSRRVISCHLGGGASVCGIYKNQSLYCSMGYSPDEGVVMLNRIGTIGTGALLHYIKTLDPSEKDFHLHFNTECGLNALIGGKKRSMKDIVLSDDEKDKFAIKVYYESLVGEIAKAFLSIGGADVLVFTGGVGENSDIVRHEVCNRLACIGVNIDTHKNLNADNNKTVRIIHNSASKVGIVVISADEASMMRKLIV